MNIRVVYKIMGNKVYFLMIRSAVCLFVTGTCMAPIYVYIIPLETYIKLGIVDHIMLVS